MEIGKKEAALEVPIQEQLVKKVIEKLNTNLPLYLKDLDIKEGSITHDVIMATIVTYSQILEEL